MDLLIDVGNTNLKWAPCKSGVVGEMRTLRHCGGLPIDLHAAWEQLASPERILVANVGGETLATVLEQACRAHWGIAPRFARTLAHAHGVRVAYQHPSRLGVDRWLALIAAHHACAAPLLVIDAGTAITYDLLLADGRHLGGLILPGVDMMRSSLIKGTRIPQVEPTETARPWASDTGAAIAAASLQAPAALAERLYGHLAAETGGIPQILATGGDAERLLPAIPCPSRHIPDLVLRGLARLGGESQPGSIT